MIINWPRLVHLEGMPLVLAKWRNIGPVHSVCIPGNFDTNSDNSAGRGLLDGIRSAQPVALSFVMTRTSTDAFWKSVVSVSSRLRYLSVDAFELRWSSCWQRDLEMWFVSPFPQ